jgi:hypothetical protein
VDVKGGIDAESVNLGRHKGLGKGRNNTLGLLGLAGYFVITWFDLFTFHGEDEN